MAPQPSGYSGLTNTQYTQQIPRWAGHYVCINHATKTQMICRTVQKKVAELCSGQSTQIIYNTSPNLQHQLGTKVMLKKESLGHLLLIIGP